MVLDDVAQRAGMVVIGAAPFDAEGLGDGDLHMVDMVGVPQRLEQGVGEAERHEVLDRLLPEIVVDPVDLAFVEDLADGVVDLARRGEIVADRFLDDHPGLRRDQPLLAELGGNRPEEAGIDGEVEGADAVLAFLQDLRRDGPSPCPRSRRPGRSGAA